MKKIIALLCFSMFTAPLFTEELIAEELIDGSRIEHGMVGSAHSTDFITIAILAKDKSHTLPLFLKCIENQTWPKDKTFLYVKTNNNNDNTKQILCDWLQKVGHLYPKIYFNSDDTQQRVEQYGQHEWNCVRFKVLGKIRQDSITWAMEQNSNYFVVDCDNFIKPNTLEAMFNAGMPIVAPFMQCLTWYGYSNYHAAIDNQGYMAHSDLYFDIYHQTFPGLTGLPVVHCAYFITHEVLPLMSYDDESYRYEYVIFSNVARKNNVPQYLDNREMYGYITFAENAEKLIEDGCPTKINEWFLP